MDDMNPKQESKRELFMSTYVYIFVSYIYIETNLNIGRND